MINSIIKKIIFLIFFAELSSTCCGQPDTLNQYDSNNKKHGKWIVYLNDYWKEVKDSSEAIYKKYIFFDHGINLYPMGPRDKSWKMEHKGDSTFSNDKIKLLDGEYKWIDEKGITRGIDVFKNGEYILYKWYFASGEINQIFDYAKTWKGESHTYSIREYDKKGKVKYYFHRNGNKGWMFYESPEEDL